MDTGMETLRRAPSMDTLLARAADAVKGRPLRSAIVFPRHAELASAIQSAEKAGLVKPVSIGTCRMSEVTEEVPNYRSGEADFIKQESPEEALETAMQMAAVGEIDMIVNGDVTDTGFCHRLVNGKQNFVPKGAVAGHVAVMYPSKYDKWILLSDAAINHDPDLQTKVALVGNLVRVGSRLGIECPKIAVLAAVEVVYPQMPVTLESAILSKMGERGQIKGAVIDGPLSFDCAISTFAAESKGIKNSAVAGQADAMLAPNIETALGNYQAMSLFGEAQMAGVVVGGRVPVVAPFAGDSPETIVHSICLACLKP